MSCLLKGLLFAWRLWLLYIIWFMMGHTISVPTYKGMRPCLQEGLQNEGQPRRQYVTKCHQNCTSETPVGFPIGNALCLFSWPRGGHVIHNSMVMPSMTPQTKAVCRTKARSPDTTRFWCGIPNNRELWVWTWPSRFLWRKKKRVKKKKDSYEGIFFFKMAR